MVGEIEVKVLAAGLAAGADLALLDVREPWEFELARIEGSVNMPMSSLAGNIDRVRELQAERDMVLVCHHGRRSMNSAQFLASQGLTGLINLTGGIDAWSLNVDSSVARY